MSLANAFNLDKSKILANGKVLTAKRKRKKTFETRTVTKCCIPPPQRLVTEQVSFYRKKIMEVPKLQEKSLPL